VYLFTIIQRAEYYSLLYTPWNAKRKQPLDTEPERGGYRPWNRLLCKRKCRLLLVQEIEPIRAKVEQGLSVLS